MFIIKLHYKSPLTEVDKYQRAHREFLDYYYKQGVILASGPLKPRTGGIIIALTTDRSQLEKIIEQDPYYLAEIADYELIEFTPIKHRDEIKALVHSCEGKLI
ncbi:MAG: YciI family protein [Legionella sp.]